MLPGLHAVCRMGGGLSDLAHAEAYALVVTEVMIAKDTAIAKRPKSTIFWFLKISAIIGWAEKRRNP